MAQLANVIDTSRDNGRRVAAWVGNDGNVWSNINGNVENLGRNNSAFQKDNTLQVLGAGGEQYGINWIDDPNPGGVNSYDRGGSGISSGGGSGSTTPAFDQSWYQSLIDSLGQEKGQASNMIRNSYGNSLNTLRGERDRAVENLDREETKLNDQRSRSLSTLSNDLSKLWQNANVQLGMFGAGNSSAAQAAAYGVSDMANKEATATNDEFNDQIGDINLTRSGYNREYDDKRKSLEDKMNQDIWKSDRGYDSEITGLRGDIANKTDNQAIRQQQVDAIRGQYGNLQAPTEKLNLPAYEGAGVQNRGISGSVAVNNPSAPQAQYFQAANTRRKDDERTPY